MELLYEELMEHYKEPRNYGVLDNFDIKESDSNPLCGDEVLFTIKLEDERIKEIKFSGAGCAISRSSDSILTEYVKGKSINEILKMSNDDFLKIYGFKPSVMRVKCALLGFIALKKAILRYLSQPIKKEPE